MRTPPPFATWLVARFAPARYREALLGDLNELFDAGRSRAWYWRQALAAVCTPRWSIARPLAAALRAALLALGLIVMGAGTLSWATTLEQDGSTPACPR